MKGHIRERSPGHWAIVIDLSEASTGRRRRKWHSFAGTKRQAQVECARLVSELSGGFYIEPAKITVGQFLERWLEHSKPLVSARTHERYREIVRKNVDPLLGTVGLTKLRPMQISEAYAKALSAGRRDGRGGLAPSPLQPRSITRQWHQLLASNKALPRIRFHDLRHAHATHMLSSGVHPKIASERLGHSSVGITMDLYSHVMPGMQEDAAARVDRDLEEVINRRTKTIG
jgi:integrase